MTNIMSFLILFVLFLFLGGVPVGFFILLLGYHFKCPQCGKLFSRQKVGETILGSYTSHRTIQDRNPTFDSEGNETGHTITKRTIPITIERYRAHYKCRNCGHTWSSDIRESQV